jgi:hypothetical protein
MAVLLLAGCGAGPELPRPPAVQEKTQSALRAEKVCAAAPLFDEQYQAVMVADHGAVDMSTPDGYTLSRDPYLEGGNAQPFSLDEVARAVASDCPDHQPAVDSIRNLLSLDPGRGPLRDEPAGPDTILGLVGNGEYVAGYSFAGQMLPGTWQLRTGGRTVIEDCFYARGAARTGDIVEKRLVTGDTTASVTLRDGETFTSDGCGLWEWIG